MPPMPSRLEPVRDVLNLIYRSRIGRYTKYGSIFVYVNRKGALSPTDQPADDQTADIVGWLDRQGRIQWRTGTHADQARLTTPAERVRARWQRRYPDANQKNTDQRVEDMWRSMGIRFRRTLRTQPPPAPPTSTRPTPPGPQHVADRNAADDAGRITTHHPKCDG